MALKLSPGPLPKRVAPPVPLRAPVWSAPGRYNGLLLADVHAGVQVPGAVLESAGRCMRLVDGRVCILFDDAVELDPNELGRALPLRGIGQGRFVSFDAAQVPALNVPPHHLALFSKGAPVVISLEGATEGSMLDFWNLDRVKRIEGAAPEVLSTLTPRVKRRDASTSAMLGAQKPEGEGATARDFSKLEWRGWWLDQRETLASRAILALILLVVAARIFSALGSLDWLYLALLAVGVVLLACLLWWLNERYNLLEQFLERSQGEDRFRRFAANRKQPSDLADESDYDREIAGFLASIRKQSLRRGVLRKRRVPHIAQVSSRLLKPGLKENEKYSSTRIADYLYQNWYFSVAQQLVSKGEYERAAFILRRLDGQGKRAVDLLVGVGEYEQAARLGEGVEISELLRAELWYRAGNRENAIEIARRSRQLWGLAERVEAGGSDIAFANELRVRFIEDLVIEGELPLAVRYSAGCVSLMVSTTTQAVRHGYLMHPDVLIQALFALPWPLEALTRPPEETLSTSGQVAELVHRALWEPEAVALRAEILRGLRNTRAHCPDENSARVRAFVEGLVRQSLVFDDRLPRLKEVATRYDCAALAVNLDQCLPEETVVEKKPGGVRLSLPKPTDRGMRWEKVAALWDGGALVSSEQGMLVLLDAGGAAVWRTQMPNLAGMVSVGAGHQVLLVLGHGLHRELRLFDRDTRSLRNLGTHEIESWAQYARDGIWLVQMSGRFAAVDLASLLGHAPVLHTFWAVSAPNPVRIVGVSYGPLVWITERHKDAQWPGLLENWNVDRAMLNGRVGVGLTDGLRESSTLVWHQQGGFFNHDQKWSVSQKGLGFGMPTQMETWNIIFHADGSPRKLVDAQMRANAATYAKHLGSFQLISAPRPGALGFSTSEPQKRDLSIWQITENSVHHRFAQVSGPELAAQSTTPDGKMLAMITSDGAVLLCDMQNHTAQVG